MRKLYQIKHTKYSVLLNHEINMFSKDAKNNYELKLEGFWKEQEKRCPTSFIFNFVAVNGIDMHKAEKILFDLANNIISRANDNIELRGYMGDTLFSIKNVVINISNGCKVFTLMEGLVTYHANECVSKLVSSQVAFLEKIQSHLT